MPETEYGLKRYLYKSIGQVAFKDKQFAQLSKEEKIEQFRAIQQENRAINPESLYKRNGVFRHLNVNECEALQTLPHGFTEGVSDSQRFKALGNAYTCDVIAHLLGYLPDTK